MKIFLGMVACLAALTTPAFAQQCKNAKQSVRTVVTHQQCPITGKMVAVNTAAAKESTIVDIAAGNDSFSTLVAAVKAAGLVETLSGKGPFTVFAPTNEAFAKLPKETLASLLKPENKDQLVSILTYHVVPGKVMAADVVKVTEAKSVQGQPIKVEVKDGKVVLNGSSTVVKTDIVGSNGVIHVIDTVILPPPATAKTIAEIAIENEDFSTLVAAVTAAGLAETLMGEGPFTVFAPTNAAFAKLPQDLVASLLQPENKEKLKAILLYHVVPGNVKAADVVNLKAAKSAQGKQIAISVVDGKVKLNNSSTVVATDIEGSNGVIHVIDTVILPPEE
jgi:transforming growth factor-beta-induced protein